MFDFRVIRLRTATAALMLQLLAACGSARPASNSTVVHAETSPDQGSPAPAPAVAQAEAKSAHAPGKDAPGVTANCAAWSNIVVGPYKYDNNQWGHGKATGPYEQCLLERTSDGKKQVGWTWDWPGFDPGVFAYPEIIYGWKPWGGASSDPRFPLKVADVEHLVMHYQVHTEATGGYNLAPEVWLVENGEAPMKGNPEGITTEIMFWMEHAGGAQPAGEVVDHPVYAGVQYELWKKENLGDKGDGKGWLYYALKSPTTQRKGSLPLHEVLSHMVKVGQIDPEHYVAGVEFGNEIFGGRGTTWIAKYTIEVRAAERAATSSAKPSRF